MAHDVALTSDPPPVSRQQADDEARSERARRAKAEAAVLEAIVRDGAYWPAPTGRAWRR